MEAFVSSVDDKLLSPDRPQPTLLHKLAMVVRVLGVVIATLSVTLNLQLASLFLRPIMGRSWYRKLADRLQQQWIDAMFFLLRRNKVHFTGDYAALQSNNNNELKTKIVMANHSTDVDWIYMWTVAQTSPFSDGPQGGHGKILLKQAIRQLPVIGTMMHLLDFVWIKRDWKEDQPYLERKLQLLTSDEGTPLWLMLFPEGVTVNTKSMAKSHQFALEQQRVKLDYTLLPRSKGLHSLIQGLRTTGREFELYDLTMSFQGYTGEVPTWEMGYERNRDVLVPNVPKLFYGLQVGECHINVARCDDVPTTAAGEDEVQAWLDERWARKDALLMRFATKQTFEDTTGAETFTPRGNVTTGLAVVVAQTVCAVAAVRAALRCVM